MPTEPIKLPDNLSERVQKFLESGRFGSADEVVGAGLRLLEREEAEDALKLEALRNIVACSMESYTRGEYQTYTPETLDAMLEDAARVARLKNGGR